MIAPAEVERLLLAGLNDADLELVDLTGTQDHWQVAIESSLFKGLSRIQQQRHVMDVFGPELKTGEVHALTIKTTVKN